MSYAGPSFLRVVVNTGGSGAWNMGLDEALLEDSFGGWTLRLYRWDRPTISLGYAQPHEQGVDTIVARRLGIPVVRRPTGGRAVLHADELTYALTGPVDHGPYRAVSRSRIDVSPMVCRLACGGLVPTCSLSTANQ